MEGYAMVANKDYICGWNVTGCRKSVLSMAYTIALLIAPANFRMLAPVYWKS